MGPVKIHFVFREKSSGDSWFDCYGIYDGPKRPLTPSAAIGDKFYYFDESTTYEEIIDMLTRRQLVPAIQSPLHYDLMLGSRYKVPRRSDLSTLPLTEGQTLQNLVSLFRKRGMSELDSLVCCVSISSSPKEKSSSVQRGDSPPESTDTTNWLSLVETFGSNLLVTTATFASIIQGLDVVERRWRERRKKQKQQPPQTSQPSSVSSSQPAASPPQQTIASDKEIIEIYLLMGDGSRHSFKRWVSDPDTLRVYIDAFSDPTSKVKPLQVVFVKRQGRALSAKPISVDITEGGKDNRQLNAILSYLEADPQP